MKMNAAIAGVGMTRFAKHPDLGLKALGVQAVTDALADAGIDASDLDAAYVGNATAGLITGQESILGQVILRSIGLGRLPVINNRFGLYAMLGKLFDYRPDDRPCTGLSLTNCSAHAVTLASLLSMGCRR